MSHYHGGHLDIPASDLLSPCVLGIQLLDASQDAYACASTFMANVGLQANAPDRVREMHLQLHVRTRVCPISHAFTCWTSIAGQHLAHCSLGWPRKDQGHCVAVMSISR